MKKLSDSSEIWTCDVTKSDMDEAIEYATISLPWTFDRMRYGPREQGSVNNRLMHILMGVLNQTILRRVLESKGHSCEMDWTKYRESDIFDFRIGDRVCDVKTSHIYSVYDKSLKREAFSTDLIIRNRSYADREWRRFFPLMVPVSQLTIDRMKDLYIFGLAQTFADIRKTEPKLNDKGFWCAGPHGKAFAFFQSTPAILAREEAGSGFQICAVWQRTQMRLVEEDRAIKITFFGEWDGERRDETVVVNEGSKATTKQEFSSLSSMRFDDLGVLDDNDIFKVTVRRAFTGHVPKSSNPKVDLNDPDFLWIVSKKSFVNLRVPEDYRIHWIGHIPYKEFIECFQKYKAYFMPHPSKMDLNTDVEARNSEKEWFAKLDQRKAKAIENGKDVPWPDFSSLIRDGIIHAGLLLSKMSGPRPIGGACYFYPPYGLWESAIYVLPQDLHPMDTL
ncbi:MAG: hypothetical protein ACE5KV_03040 [Thermoplasmata archaeon]